MLRNKWPDYILAQMPKVMDNLMPHMTGDVVPLVTDPMIACLGGEIRDRGLPVADRPRVHVYEPGSRVVPHAASLQQQGEFLQ